MSAGISMLGRDITLTIGGVTIAGYVTKQLDMSNTLVDTSDAESSGWQEFAAKPGKKALSLSVDGKVKNLELAQTYFNSESQIAECVVTFDDNNTTASTATFDAAIADIGYGMPSDEGSTFTCSLQSSGAPVFVPGT